MIKSKKFTGVYLNHKKNGDTAYYIKYRDLDNCLISIKIGDKSNGITEPYCNQKRMEYITLSKNGELPPAVEKKRRKKITTLDDLASLYFEDKKLRNRSNKQSKGRYENIISPLIGYKNVEKITKADIEHIQKKLIDKGRAPKTVNWFIQLINAIFNNAIKKEIFKLDNPCKSIEHFKCDNSRERFLTKDEVKALLDAVKDDKELWLFAKLSLTTGGRLETILHITKKDIDFQNQIITLKDLKNNSSYKGFFNDELAAELKKQTLSLGVNDTVIQASNRTISRKMKKILDRLFNQGLAVNDAKNRTVIHTLRHTFASHLAMKGIPILNIQKLLNHKDITQTLRYAKLAPDAGKEAVRGLF